MSSAEVGQLCPIRSKFSYQDNAKHLKLPSAVKLYGDADFLSQQEDRSKVPVPAFISAVSLGLTGG